MKYGAPQILAVSTAIIVIVTLFFTIKIMAEHRTEDFVIDNYIMDQGIYGSRQAALEGVEISEMHWGFSGFCTVATAYIGHQGTKISTSIPLRMPLFRYAFNTVGSADVKVVGSC